MANVSIVKLKIRRGSDSDRKLVIFDIGEIAYVTDTDSRRLFVGDGSTYGGNPAGIKFYSGDLTSPVVFKSAQVGDIIYNTNDNKVYCLTGINTNYFPDYSNPGAYQFIGTKVDNSSIEYNTPGQIKIKDTGVQSNHLNDNVADNNNGLTRAISGKLRVKYDTTTVTVNGSGELSVNQTGINLGSINTINQSINAGSIKLTSMNTSSVGLASGQIYYDPANNNLKYVP
jgi:hypothetical protein